MASAGKLKDRKAHRPVLIAAGAAFWLALLLPTAAKAEERTCRGSLGGVTVDNLRVPQSATCTLDLTRVHGTIKIERNAVLNANRCG
jgi:hypothetical protein